MVKRNMCKGIYCELLWPSSYVIFHGVFSHVALQACGSNDFLPSMFSYFFSLPLQKYCCCCCSYCDQLSRFFSSRYRDVGYCSCWCLYCCCCCWMVNAYGNFVCTIQCSLFSIRMSFPSVFFSIFNCCSAEVVADRTVCANDHNYIRMCFCFGRLDAGKSLGVNACVSLNMLWVMENGHWTMDME